MREVIPKLNVILIWESAYEAFDYQPFSIIIDNLMLICYSYLLSANSDLLFRLLFFYSSLFYITSRIIK